jgi:haloalkane dehalogenase
VIVDGAGHFVQSDAPEEFAAAIRDWWFGPGVARIRGDARRNSPRE